MVTKITKQEEYNPIMFHPFPIISHLVFIRYVLILW